MDSYTNGGSFIDVNRTLDEVEAVMEDFQSFVRYLLFTNEQDPEATDEEKRIVSENCFSAFAISKAYLESKRKFFTMKDDEILTKPKSIKA